MAFPTDASVVVLLGSWWDESTRAGMDATITATPVPAAGSNAPANATPNLTDIANYGWIKSRKWTTKPLASGLYALPLIANDDPDLSAFGGYQILAEGETPFLVNVSVSASTMQATQQIVDAIAQAATMSTASYTVTLGQTIQVVRMTEAAVLSNPAPQPPSAFLNEAQINSRIATAVAGVSGGPDLAQLDRRYASRVSSRLPQSLAGPVVAASPPTVTLSAPNAATSISGGVALPCDSPLVTKIGGGNFAKGASFPFDNFLYPRHRYPNAIDTGGPAPWSALFGFDGTKLEIYLQDRVASATYRLWVDGRPLTLGPVSVGGSGSGNGYRLIVDFGSRANRIIEFDMALVPFGGLTVGPTDTVWPVTPRGPRVIFVGDSYLGGAYTNPLATFYRTAADLLGWQDVWNDGLGGTGYLNDGSAVRFSGRVATDVIPFNPDIVVFAGGINDAGQGRTAIHDAAALAFGPVRTALPLAKLVATGPFCPDAANASGYQQIGLGIADAIAEVGGTFIDTLNPPWITGSGYVGATTGTGNADLYIGADHVHPTTEGSKFLGYRFAEAFLAAVPRL